MLLLVKHAAPAIDPAKPAATWPLSEAGRLACADLASFLLPLDIEHIVSSDEPKAMETARLVAMRLGVESSAVAGLCEQRRLTAPFFETPTAFRAAVARALANPETLVLGEETASEACDRFARAVGSLIETWPHDGPICAVTHGTVISLLVESWCGVDALETWDSLSLPSVVQIDLASRALVGVYAF